MSTFYIQKNQMAGNEICIRGEDVNHIKNVLRFEVEDKLDVCDEEGVRYHTQIVSMEKDQIRVAILEVSKETTEPSVEIDLYQGFPKSDKFELIIQKCTELGVKSVIPVITQRVVVKLDPQNESKKRERWQKIAKEAAVQSGRQQIPTVGKAINLQNSIENLSKYDIVIVPYECENERYLKDTLRQNQGNIKRIAVVIGPEGGFSTEDIMLLQRVPQVAFVSLGKRILRTETAGLVTIANILYELED